jgi:hypothetical protein
LANGPPKGGPLFVNWKKRKGHFTAALSINQQTTIVQAPLLAKQAPLRIGIVGIVTKMLFQRARWLFFMVIPNAKK